MARRSRRRTVTDPNLLAINALIAETDRVHRQRLRAADAGARGLRGALAERTRDLGTAYDTVDRAGAEASARASAALAGLSPAADPYRPIIAGEQSSGLRRAAEARARAAEEVGRIGTSIERERSSRIHQAGQDRLETLQQLSGEASRVASEAGKQAAQRRLVRLQSGQTRKNIRLQGRVNRGLSERKHKQTLDEIAARGTGKGGKSGGSGRKKYAGHSRSDYLRARDMLLSKGRPAKTLRTRGLRRDAITYLVDKRGVDAELARLVVQRHNPQRRRQRRPAGSINAILNR